MNCQKCQKQTFLPFKCPYCQGYFCSDHRLPENHNCPQIQQARTPKQETLPPPTQKQESYEYTVTYPTTPKTKTKIHFSTKEITHLTIATLLVTAVGLSYVGLPNLLSNAYDVNYVMLTAFIAMFTVSFFAHELAHKITAQREGYWAEFRLTLTGALLTLLSIIPTLFKIISPGAVMISGHANTRNIGKISIAGPATNLTLSTAFLAITLLLPSYSSLFLTGAAFNAWIALFNLIPFGIFDGLKVFVWNKKIWATTFTLSLVLTVLSYTFIL